MYGKHVALRMQTGNLDLLFRCFSVPDECMSVRCCRARAKIDVVWSFGRKLSDRLCIWCGGQGAGRSSCRGCTGLIVGKLFCFC